jgi:hypothetical protein
MGKGGERSNQAEMPEKAMLRSHMEDDNVGNGL